jgi:hypothetical protein
MAVVQYTFTHKHPMAVVQYTFTHIHPVAVVQYTFTHKHPVTAVQYTFTHKHPMAAVQYTFTYKQYTERQKILEECGPCRVFASYTLEFALQVSKNHEKPSVYAEKPQSG